MPPPVKVVRPGDSRVRPVRAFGELLAELRELYEKGSVEQVLMNLRNKPLKIDTNQGTVSGYEQGYNKKPDPVVLWGLARAYGVSLEALIAVLHANRNDPQLSIDGARRVLREHSHGPSPEVAAAALETAEARILQAAGDLTAIREGLQADAGPPPRPRR